MVSEYNKGWLKKWLTGKPHLVLYHGDDVYLNRRYIIPRNRFLNFYLHQFIRSDEAEALHDHSGWWVSLILKGSYTEHRFGQVSYRKAGSVVFREAHVAHRVELDRYPGVWVSGAPKQYIPGAEAPVWTLFISGPKKRDWGFYCPQGWRHWTEVTTGPQGRHWAGCGEK